ncbi:MAG: hypothetical protein ACLSBB_18785 [Ruthenibacterium lactatiformans]
MKQKMNLKSGMFNGLPAYACALLLLARAGLSVLARHSRLRGLSVGRFTG